MQKVMIVAGEVGCHAVLLEKRSPRGDEYL